MKKVGIITKGYTQDLPDIKDLLTRLLSYLEEMGKEPFLDEVTARIVSSPSSYKMSDIPDLVDFIIVFGGDGTMLSVARVVAIKDVPILGINLGGLGFLTAFSTDELFGMVEKIFNDDYSCDERILLKTHHYRQGEKLVHSFVLNDVSVASGALGKMIKMEVYANKQYINTVRADGLIISTPTGSTAYSLSAGGPIIHPSLNSLILTPVCPHTLSNRPIVIPGDMIIEIVLISEEASMVLDGQVSIALIQNDVIQIKRSKYTINLITTPSKNYFNVLREKLKWG